MSFSRALFRVIVGLLFVFFIISSCSKDKKNPTEPTTQDFLWLHLGGDSSKVNFANLAKIDADGEEAIQLDAFISTAVIPPYVDKNGNQFDARKLYSYQIMGDDGFSASNKGYANNTWDQMQLGHLLTANRQTIFPDELIDLPGAYNVKEVGHIYIYRKFDVITPDTTTFVELHNFTAVAVQNADGVMEQAIPLANCVQSLLTAPENNQFNMRSLDNFGPDANLTWPQFQTGYWLLTSEKTFFTDTALQTGRYKIKVLEKISVF